MPTDAPSQEWINKTLSVMLNVRPPYGPMAKNLRFLTEHMEWAWRMGLTEPGDAAMRITDALGWPRSASDDITFTKDDWLLIKTALDLYVVGYKGAATHRNAGHDEKVWAAQRLIALAGHKIATHPELPDSCEVPG